MTGYRSKKLVTDRYADPVTLDHIVDLRKENERLREVLRMWVKFWEADNSVDILDDAVLAEEAMEATREILEGEMT
jgi:hypothetical protein